MSLLSLHNAAMSYVYLGTPILLVLLFVIHKKDPIEREEAFTVPVSLQNYLDGKKDNFKKLDVIEVTSEFMSQYPNHENLKPSEKGIKTKLFELVTFSARMGER
ncbi:hypothetical protein AYY16_09930 [Morganella psychrotolerans]|uniref:hypothetical protein n=1 Tax=Morganella psychrotolerans TaxID=368603 RepID=UPI0007FD1EFD|nr:hypothetical protein [Morganella psychrotolerans]OBU05547.1 hypothetical protein AYY16_09930 [Morganella psychrotolerans]